LCYLGDDDAPTLRHKVSNFSRFTKGGSIVETSTNSALLPLASLVGLIKGKILAPSSFPSPRWGEGNIPLFFSPLPTGDRLARRATPEGKGEGDINF